MRVCYLALALVLFIAGCAHTSVQGKRQAEPSTAIEVIGLVFDDTRSFAPKKGQPQSAYSSIGVEKAQENQWAFAQSIQQGFPRVFAANGIQMQVYLRSAGAAQFRADAAGRRHVLHITPTNAAYLGSGGTSTFTMSARLMELQPARTLWTGSLSVYRPITAKIDEDLAKEFATKLVDQLRKEGIIGATPKVPALQDVTAVPLLDERGREGYRDWLTKKHPRAFVVSESGAWNATWGTNPKNAEDPKDPAERALAHCQKRGLTGCRLYAVNDRVVWTP